MISVSESLNDRNNQVNIIKLIAAYLVIIGHSYAYAANYATNDIMSFITRGKYNLGGFAVAIFFFFSGLYIAKSLMSGKYTGIQYFKRRIVRIFPPLIVVTVIIIVICGIFFTKLSIIEYFTNIDTYKYLLNCIFISVEGLPQVFSDNIYGPSVNGPIWTIKVEMLCYVAAYVIYRLRLMTKSRFQYVIYLFIISAGLLHYGIIPFGKLIILVRPVGMFLMGMMYCVYGEEIKTGLSGTVVATVMYILFLIFGLAETGLFITLPYILTYLAFQKKLDLSGSIMDRLGSCSYEIYLFGGFVGQAVVSVAGGKMEIYLNIFFTIVIATVLGYILNSVFLLFNKR